MWWWMVSSLSAFQVVFYTGSHISPKAYEPVLSRLREHNITTRVLSYSPWKRNHFSEDTYLIGHSFGGYCALLDTIQDPTPIRGVVLWNSHFNSRGKAWYPRVLQQNIKAPVLSLYGEKDERLPLRVALDDFWFHQESSYDNQYPRLFTVYPGYSHFSGIGEHTNNQTVSRIASDIISFVKGSRIQDSETMARYGVRPLRGSFLPFGQQYESSKHVFDALLRVVIPRHCWDRFHHYLFLGSQPSRYHTPIHNDGKVIRIKASHKNVNRQILEQFYQDLFYEQKPDLCFEYTRLPPNLIGLGRWILCCPGIQKKNQSSSIQVMEWDLPGNRTYYSLAHPHQYLSS